MNTELTESRYNVLAALINADQEMKAGDLALKMGEAKANVYFHLKALADDGVLINRGGSFRAKAGITLDKFTVGRSAPARAEGAERPTTGSKNPVAKVDRAINDLIDAMAAVRQLIITPAEREEYELLKRTRDALASQGFKFKK